MCGSHGYRRTRRRGPEGPHSFMANGLDPTCTSLTHSEKGWEMQSCACVPRICHSSAQNPAVASQLTQKFKSPQTPMSCRLTPYTLGLWLWVLYLSTSSPHFTPVPLALAAPLYSRSVLPQCLCASIPLPHMFFPDTHTAHSFLALFIQ